MCDRKLSSRKAKVSVITNLCARIAVARSYAPMVRKSKTLILDECHVKSMTGY